MLGAPLFTPLYVDGYVADAAHVVIVDIVHGALCRVEAIMATPR